MDDLVTWLRAQLDEDERVAQAQREFISGWYDRELEDPQALGPLRPFDAAWSPGDPRRVLREVEAKRRLMEIHQRRADYFAADSFAQQDSYANCCHGCGYEGDCDDPITENINDCPVLLALASVYQNGEGPPASRS